MNWLVAYPYKGMGESLPPHFEAITLQHLLALPVGTRISFEPFADKLIEAAGLKWTSRDTTYHRIALHGAIHHMVINILADFEVVERKYQEEPLGKGTISKLVAFQITSFSKGLLESLK